MGARLQFLLGARACERHVQICVLCTYVHACSAYTVYMCVYRVRHIYQEPV
jgi:hypothetical protein